MLVCGQTFFLLPIDCFLKLSCCLCCPFRAVYESLMLHCCWSQQKCCNKNSINAFTCKQFLIGKKILVHLYVICFFCTKSVWDLMIMIPLKWLKILWSCNFNLSLTFRSLDKVKERWCQRWTWRSLTGRIMKIWSLWIPGHLPERKVHNVTVMQVY